MVERVTIDHEGNFETEKYSSKNYSSSNDYQGSGVQVKSKGLGFLREVHDPADLNEDDLVSIDGMDVLAKQAREMGLLPKVFQGVEPGGQPPQANTPEPDTQRSNTGYAEYDTAVDALNDLIDDGAMTFEEGQTYDIALAEIAMSGLSVENMIETIDGLENGSVNPIDVPGDVKSMAKAIQERVQDTAEKAALTELGQEGFDYLRQLSNVHPGVDRVVRQYAQDRAQGKAGNSTWADLAAHIQSELGL